METEEKEVTYKHLKKGQLINGWRIGNSTTYSKAIVSGVNPAFVSVLQWGKVLCEIPSEEAMFKTEMSEEEFVRKYTVAAADILISLSNKLEKYEIGYHEMWNGWVSYDPYEMACRCGSSKLKVIGVCEGVQPRGYKSHIIGICVEDETGEKFWCHADKEYLEEMIEEHAYLLK